MTIYIIHIRLLINEVRVEIKFAILPRKECAIKTDPHVFSGQNVTCSFSQTGDSSRIARRHWLKAVGIVTHCCTHRAVDIWW